MKRIIMIFIGLIIVLFVNICIIVGTDNNYLSSLKKEILENTSVNDIEYINSYNDYYIVTDNEYLYLFDSDYEEITRIKLSLVYQNKENYDIVYRNKTIVYMNDYKNKEGIIYRYYDIYTYELIDEILVGG